jgi:GNAT superfamily N-acetyltransferase
MTITIVSTSDRPDLIATTGVWRWEAFFVESMKLSEIVRLEGECASNGALVPTVLVLLDELRPVGMVALCLDDLEERPDLNPWLAGLYVDPAHRGKGYALRLIDELETLARSSGIERLSLYTSTAQGLYSSAGWTTTETFERTGEIFCIMRKYL